jgi:hypothetical protein
MQGLFTQTVALIAIAVLALPPGICCGMTGTAAQEAPAADACCHEDLNSPAEQRVPAQPTTNCCCTLKAAATSSTVQAPESMAAGFLGVESIMAPPAIEAARFAAPAVVFTGPPLRILQCVWRI